MNVGNTIAVISETIVAIGALIAILRFVVPGSAKLIERWRSQQQLWPMGNVSASYLGPGGKYVPGGDYRCTRDHHELNVDYATASGTCPACGRRYKLMFSAPEETDGR